MSFRALVAKFAASRVAPMAVTTGPTPVDSVESARDRLHQAHAEVAAARARLDEAKAARSRVESLMSDADDAEIEADRAAERASAVAKAWALSGARPDVSPGDQALLDHATDARRRAEQARLQAGGAAAALPAVGDAVRVSEVAVERAEQKLRKAVVDIMVREAEQHFQTLHRLHDDAQRALDALAGLRDLTAAWGNAHPWAPYSSVSTATDISLKLRTLWPTVPDARSTKSAADAWAKFGDALHGDPDAEFPR